MGQSSASMEYALLWEIKVGAYSVFAFQSKQEELGEAADLNHGKEKWRKGEEKRNLGPYGQ